MCADRFSPLTLTKCSGRGRVSRPLIYTSRAVLSLDSVWDPQPFQTGSTKIHIVHFQSKQLFDVCVVTGRPLVRSFDRGDERTGSVFVDEFLYQLKV